MPAWSGFCPSDGSQDVTIDTHAADGPGSHLSVAYAGVLIWLYDLRAVTTYGRVWSETAANIHGSRLPQTRELDVPPVGGYSPTIGIRATGTTDQVDIYPRGEAVIVKTGHVTWAVYDRDAFVHQVALWHRVAKIAVDRARPVRQSAAADPQVAISRHR